MNLVPHISHYCSQHQFLHRCLLHYIQYRMADVSALEDGLSFLHSWSFVIFCLCATFWSDIDFVVIYCLLKVARCHVCMATSTTFFSHNGLLPFHLFSTFFHCLFTITPWWVSTALALSTALHHIHGSTGSLWLCCAACPVLCICSTHCPCLVFVLAYIKL